MHYDERAYQLCLIFDAQVAFFEEVQHAIHGKDNRAGGTDDGGGCVRDTLKGGAVLCCRAAGRGLRAHTAHPNPTALAIDTSGNVGMAREKR